MSNFDEFEAFEASAHPVAPAAPYLTSLNPAQREAVERLDGPLLMLAGAGTGKTKALTTRIVHLIETRRAAPWQILAVTFTNKAAREMKNRVDAMLDGPVEGVRWLGTFHAICVKLLRRHAELVGLKSNFTILDKDDQLRLLKQLIQAENIDDKRWPPRMLAGIIDDWKNRALSWDKVPARDSDAFNGRGIDLYRQYQTRLRELNAADFGDLLLHMLDIFQNHPDILALYQDMFRYIMVDEYQDTNVAQYLWLRLLAQGHRNICCVGDDDQSIYGWRGAEVRNILKFEKDFEGAHVVRLEQNYRSTPHILAAAGEVIRANKNRLGKELWTDAQDGEKLRLMGLWDGEEEARWIGEEIEAMQSGTRGMRRFGLEDIAILVRASFQMRAFEDRFLSIGLPYRVIGGPRFYERMEIRDAMAYFRIVVSSGDDLAFERILNTPKRGLGNKASQSIHAVARMNGVSLLEGAALALRQGEIKGRGGKALNTLLANIARWRRLARGPVPVAGDDVLDDEARPLPGGGAMGHVELAQIILDESGYTGMWQNDKSPDAPGRLENLKELVKALESFDNLQGFLEHVALVMENDTGEGEEKLSIMTLHAAKGLEFPAVFLPGWEEGLFPSQRSMDETGIKGLEEERRLAYVGITRAEELCTITHVGNRQVFGRWQSQIPSRFVEELPQAHIEDLSLPGLHSSHVGRSDLTERAARADVYNSPGWRRLQERQQERPEPAPIAAQTDHHVVGARVFHLKFGYGEVVAIEADKLDVNFDKAGRKKVVARFVTSNEEIPF